MTNDILNDDLNIDGTLTADEFVGDGSGLTGVTTSDDYTKSFLLGGM